MKVSEWGDNPGHRRGRDQFGRGPTADSLDQSTRPSTGAVQVGHWLRGYDQYHGGVGSRDAKLISAVFLLRRGSAVAARSPSAPCRFPYDSRVANSGRERLGEPTRRIERLRRRQKRGLAMRAAWWALAVGQFAFCPGISSVAAEASRMTVPRSAFSSPHNDPAQGFRAEGVQALFFNGLAWKGKPTRVFAWVGVPALKSGEKVPGIVLVHGGGGTAFDAWVRLWVSRGYAAIAMDTCGCVPKGSYGNWQRHDAGGPPGWAAFERADEPMEDQWPYHAVADVILAHSLLRSMPQVDAGRIGITGISWGGYLTCVVSGLDDRFRFAVPVYGCGFLGDNSAWAPALKKLAPRGSGGSRCGTRRIISRTVKCPNSGSPAPTISHTRWTRSRSRIGSRAVLQPCASGCGCRMAIAARPRTLRRSLRSRTRVVRHGTPLATILDHGRDRDRVWARYRSESTIASAELLYTGDEGAWPDRRWETAPAKLDLSAKTVTASLPPTTKVFYLNLIDDHKRIVSTEHEETKSTLPNTSPLTEKGDLSQAMLDGLHRFAERKIDESVEERAKLWKRDTSSHGGLREIDPGQPRVVSADHRDRRSARARDDGTIRRRRQPGAWWPRTTPSGSNRCAGRCWRASTARACCWSRRDRSLGYVIALPDADQTPEQVVGLAPGVAPGIAVRPAAGRERLSRRGARP